MPGNPRALITGPNGASQSASASPSRREVSADSTLE
jgi:hypothetical protein